MRIIAFIFAAAAFSTCVDAFVFSWFQPTVIVRSYEEYPDHTSSYVNKDNDVDNGGCFRFDAPFDYVSVSVTCSSQTSISYRLCASSSCGTCGAAVSTTTSNEYIPLGPDKSFNLICDLGPAMVFVLALGGLAAFVVFICLCNSYFKCCCYKRPPPARALPAKEMLTEYVALLAQQREPPRTAPAREEALDPPTRAPQAGLSSERPAAPISRQRSAWAVYKSEHLTVDAIEYLVSLGALDDDERVAKCIAQPADVGKRLSRGQVAKLVEFGVFH